MEPFAGADSVFGVPVEIELDGVKLKMDRTSIADEAELKGRIRSERLQALWRARSQFKGFPIDWEKTLALCAQYEPDFDDIRRYCSTFAGAVALLWLRVRKQHPQITEARIAEYFASKVDLCGMYLFQPEDPAPQEAPPSSASSPEGEAPAPKCFGA